MSYGDAEITLLAFNAWPLEIGSLGSNFYMVAIKLHYSQNDLSVSWLYPSIVKFWPWKPDHWDNELYVNFNKKTPNFGLDNGPTEVVWETTVHKNGIPRLSGKGRGVYFQNLRNVTKKPITEIFVAFSLLSKLSRGFSVAYKKV